MVFTLAEKTGWAIDYIMWEIPICIINQANNVYLWTSNASTRLASDKTASNPIAKQLLS
jgi:hypothetical protein